MVDRRRFLGAAAGAAAALAVPAAADAKSVPGGSNLVEYASQFDLESFRRAVTRPAEFKVVWDLIAVGKAFDNVKNCLNGYHFGFGFGPHKAHMAMALHGAANTANFSDALWAKYRLGEWLGIKDPKTHLPATRNIWLHSDNDGSHDPQDERGIYQDTSIEGLQRRGVTFFT